jgi:hypothetical protein
MMKTVWQAVGQPLIVAAAATLLAACADQTPLAPRPTATQPPKFAMAPGADTNAMIATLQRVTARYHNIDAAKDDGFVLLHDCETRLNDEPVGTVYVNFDRLLDGVIDPEKPDGLIYEPSSNGLRLVGVELAVPRPLWTQPEKPQFLGTTFQDEDEFDVFALHVWVWRNNPEGLFAESNPNVSCGA